jgi:hypothetical protein
MEQVGPIINSKKIICTGARITGYAHPNAKGTITVRIIGM